MQTLKKLRPDHWAWLHAKVAIMIWAVLFFMYTPFQLQELLEYTIICLVSSVIVFGVGVSIVGLFMSFSKYTTWARRGENIEISGLSLALAGPIVYFLARVWLVFSINDGQGIPIAALAYSITALLLVRIVIVVTHRKRVTSL